MSKDYLDKWEERQKQNTEIIEQQQTKTKMMRTKINELISERRYIGRITVDDLIDDITKEKEISEKKGYRDLELDINEDTGIIDFYLWGDRDLTEEEVDLDERIAVLARMKNKTSKGMTRDDLLNQNKDEVE